jgi:hypothetical protein
MKLFLVSTAHPYLHIVIGVNAQQLVGVFDGFLQVVVVQRVGLGVGHMVFS